MTPHPHAAQARRAAARSGFTLIELLIVVVIIGILAAIAVPKFSATKEKAYIAKMKSDLRNLATAQESYASSNQTYYNGPLPNAAMAYNPSPGVTVTIDPSSNAAGWSAQATMPAATAKSCSLFVGTAAPIPPATVEGQVACT